MSTILYITEKIEQVEDVVLITKCDFPEAIHSHENTTRIPNINDTNISINRKSNLHTDSQKRTCSWTDTSYNDDLSTKQARYKVNLEEPILTDLDNQQASLPVPWNYMNDISGDSSQTSIPEASFTNTEIFGSSSSNSDAGTLSQFSNANPEWLNSMLSPGRERRPRHSRDKSFVCHHEGCTRQFYYKGDLARHLRINHKT